MIFNIELLKLKIVLQLLLCSKNISLYQQVAHTLMTEYFNLIHLVNYCKINPLVSVFLHEMEMHVFLR